MSNEPCGHCGRLSCRCDAQLEALRLTRLSGIIRERHPSLGAGVCRDISALVMTAMGLTRLGRAGIIPEIAVSATNPPGDLLKQADDVAGLPK